MLGAHTNSAEDAVRRRLADCNSGGTRENRFRACERRQRNAAQEHVRAPREIAGAPLALLADQDFPTESQREAASRDIAILQRQARESDGPVALTRDRASARPARLRRLWPPIRAPGDRRHSRRSMTCVLPSRPAFCRERAPLIAGHRPAHALIPELALVRRSREVVVRRSAKALTIRTERT